MIAEALGFGTEAITTNADTHTTTIADGATDPGRAIYLKYTGTLDSACTITIGPNTISRLHFIENATSGSQNIIISQGSGANITIPPGNVKVVYLDGAGSGAAVVDAFASLSVVDVTASNVVTGSTLEATGDTSAGDSAAIGFTSTEGLILTGQGSTNDVTIKNDADADVISIPTGATGVTFAGDITANGDTNTFSSANANDPLLIIKNTTNDTDGARLRFVKDKGAAGADNDIAGQIEFFADDDNQDNILFAKITAQVADASNGAPDRYGWSSRKAGDDTSNPFPSFTGGKINDVTFHKNRFGVLSDENIIFSVAGNFYNFFPISVMTGLDSNPIDISVSNNEVSILKHAAAFDQSLLLFSDFQQFSLNSSDGAFTPSNVSVDVVTQFESTAQAPPISSGKFVYFPFQRGEYSGVREYFVDIGSADSNDATDITAHVPQYIKGTISKMVVSSTDQMIAVLSTDDTKRVYIYKNFWQGQEKIQNSWSHWAFDGDILNCAFLGSTLKLLVKRSDGLYLEDINLSLDSAEAVMEDDTAVLLDRRVKLTHNQTVAGHLPYNANKPSNMVYVTDNARKLTTEAQVTEYLAEHSSNVVYAGIPYTFEYEFSRFIHKENELPIQTAKLQIRNINLLYNKTGFFNVKVNVTPGTIKIPDGSGGTTTVTPRTNYSKNFSGMLTNTSSFGEYKLLSGTFKSSVMTNSSNCNIILENNEYLPCAFQSAEWEGFLHKRSQRV